MGKQHYKRLVKRFRDDQITPEEVEIFIHLLKNDEINDTLLEVMNKDGGITEADELSFNRKPTVRPLIFRIAVAASILLVLSVGVYLLSKTAEKNRYAAKLHPVEDILPGGNKATLILGDGSKLALNDHQGKILAHQAQTSVQQYNGGKVVYHTGNKQAKPVEAVYNTLLIPTGGQYKLVLADGTRVWLNSETSLRFPVQFQGKERVVELSGEAYFEVAKNKSMPFRVKSSGQTVEVLGTHFNIKAYTNEPVIKTTLLEGRVKVINLLNKTVILKPGEQAGLKIQQNSISVYQADTDQAVAWKDGYFQFSHADIKEVMNQLARWYNVSVKYEQDMPSQQFGGAIQRDLKLSQVLKILEKSQVHFQIKGREVVVMR